MVKKLSTEHKKKIGLLRKNKTYIEMYGEEKAKKIIEKISTKINGDKKNG